MTELFETNIQYLKGVGPKKAQLYHKLGVDTVGSLLRYFPRGYLDLSHPVPVAEAPFDRPCCVLGRVVKKSPPARIPGGRVLYKVNCTDFQHNFWVTFFNAPYAFDALKPDEDYLFFGRFGGNFNKRDVVAPQIFRPGSDEFIPIYPLTKGLTSKAIAKDIGVALSLCDKPFEDPLPHDIRQKYGLCEYDFAMRNIHTPQNENAAQLAKSRMTFDELLTLQLGLANLKNSTRKQNKYTMHPVEMSEFYSRFAFEFTGAQKSAIAQIERDFGGDSPMVRLLQGDVGSGKTAVAAAGVFIACKNGLQSAFMAPTEILATQHFEGLSRIFEPLGIKCALLTGSTKAAEKRQILQQLKDGEIDLLIGTHALISKGVDFYKLGFVITDEQHRFGVKQRSALADKGITPHMLVMSATPIPRTLALIIYGDLDISVLNEKPAGRKEIDTYKVDFSYWNRAVAFAEKQIAAGQQVYVVCPLVEESESELHDAAATRDTLQQMLPHRKVGLVHGKQRPAEKEKTMQAFLAGEYDILVSTTVIEVGVDVPNANLMIVLDADRFGLSTLHQLRGRVGRSDIQSYCILISDNQSETTAKRLNAMCQTNDGFKLSDIDLQLRGPGNFFGSEQHGLPALKLADLLGDKLLLAQSSEAAHEILARDPQLTNYPLLKQMVKHLFDTVGEYGLS